MADQKWGIDCSYDGLTLAEGKRLREAGVEVFGQCLWTGAEQPAVAVNNIKVAHASDLIPFGYISCSPRGPKWDGEAHVKAGYDGLTDDVKALLRHCALDIELEGLTFDQHVVPGMTGLINRGFAPLMYTSFNAWVNYLGNPRAGAGWYLWNAFWDGDPDYDFMRFPYGHDAFILIGEQYTGGQNVEGQFADRNRFEGDFFAPPPPVPPPPRWITAINTEFPASDRVRFTVYYNEGEPQVIEG